MRPSIRLISVVSPAWNEAASLRELVSRIRQATQRTGHSYEILIVENGSTDNSIEVLKELSRSEPCLRYIKLSRNFGHQGALIAGLEACRGDCAITIDADLQQPPELINEMVHLWEEGYDVVYTTKEEHNIRFIKKLGMKLFYRLMSFMAHMKLNYGQSDFRLIDRKVIDTLNGIPEREKFLRGLIYWMGYNQIGLKYKVDHRFSGESKFSLSALVKFALNGIFAFSIFPLRVYLYSGVLLSSLCLMYAIFIGSLKLASMMFPEYLKSVVLPPGWVAVVYLVTFFGGFQLIGIGLLGEYLGKTLKQVKGRPVYIVTEDSDKVSKDIEESPLYEQ